MSINQFKNHVNGNIERVGTPAGKLADVMVDDSANITGRHVSESKNNLDRALKDFDKAKMAIYSVSDELHEKMESLSRRSKESVSRAKDASAQMADAMNKMTKVLGPDFEKRLDQLDQLTSCMERLIALNDSGRLTSMLDSLRKT